LELWSGRWTYFSPVQGKNKRPDILFRALIPEAEGKGFEPLYTDPESAVLPLDEPPVL
jgi:hypothetical protein